MVTEEILDRLKELQDILAQKNAVEAKKKEAPGVLASSEELLEKTKREFIEKDAKRNEYKEEIAHLERELFEAESAREKAEKDMDNVTTQREYEALDNAIRSANEREQTVRKQLQVLERQDQNLDDELKLLEENIDFQEKELEQRKAQISEEMAGYEAELAELKRLEDEASPEIDRETKANLERIIKSKDGVGVVSVVGVAAVNGYVCTGCHMILPAQFANDVRAGMSIQYCPYCSRILYYDESSSDEDVGYDADDAGSLADLYDDDDDMEDEFDDEMEGEAMDYDE